VATPRGRLNGRHVEILRYDGTGSKEIVMPPRSRSLVVLAVTFALGVAPHAVGIKETAKITITSTLLAQPIEIIDPTVLGLSNVFAGAFIGEQVAPPDVAGPHYTIVFDIQTLNGVKTAAYMVAYSKNRWTGERFIYLPGPGDASYRRNISTILRDGQDGTWHRAAEAWGIVIDSHLE
jgi:hypothetical protein